MKTSEMVSVPVTFSSHDAMMNALDFIAGNVYGASVDLDVDAAATSRRSVGVLEGDYDEVLSALLKMRNNGDVDSGDYWNAYDDLMHQ